MCRLGSLGARVTQPDSGSAGRRSRCVSLDGIRTIADRSATCTCTGIVDALARKGYGITALNLDQEIRARLQDHDGDAMEPVSEPTNPAACRPVTSQQGTRWDVTALSHRRDLKCRRLSVPRQTWETGVLRSPDSPLPRRRIAMAPERLIAAVRSSLGAVTPQGHARAMARTACIGLVGFCGEYPSPTHSAARVQAFRRRHRCPKTRRQVLRPKTTREERQP